MSKGGEHFLAQLRDVVGQSHVLTSTHDMAPLLTDWRKRFTGKARAVVLPANTEQVARVVQHCAAARVPIVPQGGNTGLVGGATPDTSGEAIVLGLRRMHAVRAVDHLNNTIVVEAGCPLQALQEAATQAQRLFPLSLASEGSCTIGGNLSTNAGGTQVLRYGNTRELCLGIEVVTAQGEIWSSLSGLRKDNTGYDLRDLFIGAEGTLGIITAACMKLYPQPRGAATALCAIHDLGHAQQLLEIALNELGPLVTAFEVFSDTCLRLVEKHFQARSPFVQQHPHYLLIELSDHEDQAHAETLLGDWLARAIESGLAIDAVIAQHLQQARQLWALRENISEAQAAEGKNIKHDISVPISRIPEFVMNTDAMLQSIAPGVRMVCFGHLGDGNLHYNVSPALDASGAAEPESQFLARQEAIYQLVHDQVAAFGGSISAEHGIGQLKRTEITRYKSPVEIGMMRAIKHALDPLGIMNPGKVL
jgi:FAD/FMN-containing dehydrogenase